MKMQQRQRGVTVVMLALFIAVLIIFAALALDVGVLYTARTSAQHIADAAALAGAYTFLNSGNAQPASAQAAAAAMVSGKQVFSKSVTATSAVTLGATSNRVAVTVHAVAPVFFARLFWTGDVPITTTATAEAASNPTAGTECLRPFWITNSQGGDCSKPLINSDGTFNSTWAGKAIAWHGNPTGSGQGGGSGGTGVPSQWGLIQPRQFGLDFPDMISTCSTQVKCKATLQEKTGDVQSINSTGHPYVSDLIGQTPGGTCTPVPNTDEVILQGGQQDRWVAPYKYLPYTSTSPPYFDTSKSVVTVAIWDDCSGPAPTPGNGTFEVAGFAQVFIDCAGSSSQKTIWGHVVGAGSCNGGGGGGAGGGSGNVTIRLIQPVP